MDELRINNSVIQLVQGDITQEETDAIVNAANKQLSPGGGVSGAIHKAAGPSLWEDTKSIGGCETGAATITYGHNLKAKYVIHTVGPIYSGSPEDSQLLHSCFIESLHLASTHDVKTISFPAISTGIFGYPISEAANVSLRAVRDYLLKHQEINTVRFVLFSENDLAVFKKTLEEL